jgi:TonB family protein
MVIMTIAKDGRLAGVALRYASGAPGFDQAAMTAIKLAAPFPPVPDSLSKGRLPISVGFSLIIISDVRRMLLQ